MHRRDEDNPLEGRSQSEEISTSGIYYKLHLLGILPFSSFPLLLVPLVFLPPPLFVGLSQNFTIGRLAFKSFRLLLCRPAYDLLMRMTCLWYKRSRWSMGVFDQDGFAMSLRCRGRIWPVPSVRAIWRSTVRFAFLRAL